MYGEIQTNTGKVERMPQVAAQLDELTTALNAINEILEVLYGKLAPILLVPPTPPTRGDIEKAQQEQELCPLANQVRGLVLDARNISSKQNSLLRMLEI